MELEKELPFRLQARLQKTLKGVALINGHDEVERSDYKEFHGLFYFMNMDFKTLEDRFRTASGKRLITAN